MTTSTQRPDRDAELGITSVDDLLPMHNDVIRHAGAAIPPGDWERHDPFLSMMNDRFKPGAFGDHPHRGFETITFVMNTEAQIAQAFSAYQSGHFGE